MESGLLLTTKMQEFSHVHTASGPDKYLCSERVSAEMTFLQTKWVQVPWKVMGSLRSQENKAINGVRVINAIRHME